MSKATQAILLVGGKGTRIQSLFPDRPKALVPVNGEPFIHWQIEWLKRGGITDVHLASGYMADALRDWVEAHPFEGVRVTVSEEPEPLGTAGGLKYIEEHLCSDPFYVLNGDSIAPNLDFQSLERVHADSSNHWKNESSQPSSPEVARVLRNAGERVFREAAPPATIAIAVTHIKEAGRYGTVEFDDDGRLTAFREKASRDEGWINAGVYLMTRPAMSLIEPGKRLSLETDIFPQLATAGCIFAQPIDPPLLDMGTPDGLRNMEAFLG